MDTKRFEQCVARAFEEIPEHFRVRMRNVAIVIEDAPTKEQLHECLIADDQTMYACYEGVAQIDRAVEEPLMPDRIIIFRKPLEEDYGDDPAALTREIATTVRHEIAHHFGIDDDRLEELGKY